MVHDSHGGIGVEERKIVYLIVVDRGQALRRLGCRWIPIMAWVGMMLGGIICSRRLQKGHSRQRFV